jgi:eukaryotic-like serine/threonine-protein kinase
MSTALLHIGDQFDRYIIRAHIARGGMSDIYRAFDTQSQRDVILKIPDSTGLGDPVQFERFQRELEVTQAMDHPAIQRGLGSGVFQRTPYLAAEFIEGRSLRDILDGEAPLALPRAIELIKKIADGIAYCHEHDIVHRDLKPENILITPDGQPIIIDFGLALTKKGRRVTYSGLSNMAGTPEYMAPEQVDGKRGDPRTDIYAIGVIFYEMLAGQAPYSGDNAMAIMAQQVYQAIPRLDQRRKDVPAPMAAIITCCLQKKPEDRFPDMRAFLNALEHPETVDLAILDTAGGEEKPDRYWLHQTLFAIAISIGILLALTLLALLLQTFKHSG